MILLPYPHAADDHQRANARIFFENQSAIVVEHEVSPERTIKSLETALRSLATDSERRRQMGLAVQQLAHPDAAEKIVNLILELAQ